MNYQSIQLQIPNDKGLKLATEIYKPDGDGPFPVIHIFHGFMGYKESTDYVDLATRLSQNGFVVVRFTTAGFGDSEGTLQDDYRLSQHRRDAEMVYEYISKLPYIDIKRIGVCGHSMGGRLAVLFGQEHPEVRSLCIISSPVSFTGTLYDQLRPEWKKLGYFERVSGRDKKAIRIPYAYCIDEQKIEHDTLIAAGRVTTPHALVIAGDADTEVPWQETKKVFEALKCPKEFLLFPGVEHRYKYQDGMMTTVHKPIVSFFQKYL